MMMTDAATTTEIQQRAINNIAEIAVIAGFSLQEALESFRYAVINRTLIQTGGNQSAAARLLKLHRNTVSRIMAEMRALGMLTADVRPYRRYAPKKRAKFTVMDVRRRLKA